jgi:conjugal transfer/entry exclusion protein
VAETIIQSLNRLEATAETIQSLAEKVTDLESQFKEYVEKMTEALKAASVADALPERLDKIDETASPLKESADDVTAKLLEMAKDGKSTLDSVESDVKEMEKGIGIRS